MNYWAKAPGSAGEMFHKLKLAEIEHRHTGFVLFLCFLCASSLSWFN